MSSNKPKQVMGVRFRDSFRLPRTVEAAAAEAELTKLHEKHGNLAADQVVKAATPQSSPLHPLFQWDNTAAAHEYRLWQARHVIGSLMVTVSVNEGEPVEIRRFMHVMIEARTMDPAPRYMDFNAVLSDEELRAQQVSLAMSELGRWAARWVVLDELQSCVKAIRRWQKQYAVPSTTE